MSKLKNVTFLHSITEHMHLCSDAKYSALLHSKSAVVRYVYEGTKCNCLLLFNLEMSKNSTQHG